MSGRGVGMDVVRTNIERIGGSLDMQTRPGLGTTIKVKIPLTLAIVPALIVSSGGDRFAIPQVSLLELVGLDAEGARTKVESVHGAPVYRLRGQILPIVYLNRELGTAGGQGDDAAATIVVLKADDRQFGLVVDQVNDTEEIVVKPLSPQCKGVDAFSGCTIMGDGHVALILDVLGLAQRAHVIDHRQERRTPATVVHQATGSDGDTLLVVGVGAEGRVAVPLSAVDRLEEFPAPASSTPPAATSSNTATRSCPSSTSPEPSATRRATNVRDVISVVVCVHRGRLVGLVVDRIVDIVEQAATIQQPGDRPGIVGSLVVQGAVTELLDIDAIVGSQLGFPEVVSNA